VYREIKRVLKPGAPFTFHDFAMTEKFDERVPEHRRVRNWVEFGNGITKMPWVPQMRAGVKKAGEFYSLLLSVSEGRSRKGC